MDDGVTYEYQILKQQHPSLRVSSHEALYLGPRMTRTSPCRAVYENPSLLHTHQT